MAESDYLQPEKITDILKKQLYSTGGVYIGTIEDLEFEQESGNVTGILVKLKVKVESKKIIAIPFEFVSAIGDIALVHESPSKAWWIKPIFLKLNGKFYIFWQIGGHNNLLFVLSCKHEQSRGS